MEGNRRGEDKANDRVEERGVEDKEKDEGEESGNQRVQVKTQREERGGNR